MRSRFVKLGMVVALVASTAILSTSSASADSSYWKHIRDYWSATSNNDCRNQGSSDAHNPASPAIDYQCDYLGYRVTPHGQAQDGWALWELYPA